MNARKKDEVGPGTSVDLKALENFTGAYISAYREHISAKDMDEMHTPQFYRGYPYSVDIYLFGNGAVCAFFKKSNRAKLAAVEGDFADAKTRLDSQDLDFMVTFPPFTTFNEDEAKRIARADVERDLRESRRLELLTAADSHISGIHQDIQSVVDLNPWLDAQAAEQRKKLDRARELILELYKEVDVSREERISDYMSQLSELMAFEKGDMEDAVGQVELEMETALEEIDNRISGLESSLSDMGDTLDTVKVATLKLEKAGPGPETRGTLEKIQTSIKDLTRDFKDIEKEFNSAMAEFTEVKETIMRDGKRTYNLNERVTDLERNIAILKQNPAKDVLSAVKALEGRFNILEKNIRDRARMSDIQNEAPIVIESPVVETIETTPEGATVKKTVKKTTTKKTTRHK